MTPTYPQMGWLQDRGEFRLRAPSARFCEIVFRDHPDGDRQLVVPMQTEPVGPGELRAWVAHVVPPLPYYRYRVHFKKRTFDVADPWSRHVVRRKAPGHPTWSVADKRAPFDWRGDAGVTLLAEDAIILEAHVADLTADPSAGCRWPGTYAGLAETHAAAVGGLPHIMRLGVNALQLLPVASWPFMESANRNNHWGYMPSFPLAASAVLSRAWRAAEAGDWVGIDRDGHAHDPGDELRATIRDLHARGIAVILDVVFNHVSLHDQNPLLLLDPGSWFRRDASGQLTNDSGCGNDLATDDPDVRGLILAAVGHWFSSYNVDGIRLDLAELIDDQTLAAIADAAREQRPDALLIAEPWSFRGRRPSQIAELGYAVWNDDYRNAIKGRQPHETGYVFGGRADRSVRAALAGSTVHEGGFLAAPEQSLNYIESHDDLTFGDFTRLALGEVGDSQIVTRRQIRALGGTALRIHKLAAATLLASRGPVMLAQGQCFGRAKVTGGRRGRINGNSYDRADGTNYIDWRDRAENPELVAWYCRWIALRKSMLLPAWQQGLEPVWLATGNPHGIGYRLDGDRAVAVLLNSDRQGSAEFELGPGAWAALAGGDDAEIRRSGTVVVAPVSAILLAAA